MGQIARRGPAGPSLSPEYKESSTSSEDDSDDGVLENKTAVLPSAHKRALHELGRLQLISSVVVYMAIYLYETHGERCWEKLLPASSKPKTPCVERKTWRTLGYI